MKPGSRIRRWCDPAVVAAAAMVAVAVRSLPIARGVLAGDGPWLLEHDPWYHARLALHWAENFPHRLRFDPWLRFPTGQEVPVAPLFDLLVAFPAWLCGLDERETLVLAAWLPPVLAGICVVLLYALGRLVFDRRVGLLAAALVAVEPGAFLVRTTLGFADHHALEVTLALAVLLLLGRAAQRPPEARRSDRRTVLRAVVAGIALYGYLLAWTGGALLVALLGAGALLQILLDHHRGLPVNDTVRALAVACGVAALLLVPWWRGYPRWELQMLALGAAGIGAVTLGAISAMLRRRATPRWLLPAAALLLAAATAGALAALAPELSARLAIDLRRFTPSGAALTVGEVRPLLRLGAETSLLPAWLQWRTTLVYGLGGMIALAAGVLRRPRAPGAALLLAWSAGVLAASLGQARFSYYLSVALALLAAVLCDAVLRLGAHADGRTRGRPLFLPLAAAAVAALVFYPAAGATVATVRGIGIPSQEWRRALDWLREETPEPFGSADAFLSRFQPPPAGQPFRYPEGAYGVLAWWDHGYWIVQRARRIPIANPTQGGAREVAQFWSETDAAAALARLDRLGARYVIADRNLAARLDGPTLSLGFLPAIATWSGADPAKWFQQVVVSGADGSTRSGTVFRTAYYRSMAARASALGMAARAPEGPFLVARFPTPGTGEGAAAGLWPARDYEQAAAAIARDPTLEIVGLDPARPPIPLEAIPELVPVYGTPMIEGGVVVLERRRADL